MDKLEDLVHQEIQNVTYNFWDFKSKYDFVDQWFLMGSPVPILVITSAYLLFVLKLGPEYLKHRKPYQLKGVLLVYNAFQVCLSAWMTYLAGREIMRVGVVQRTCLTDTKEKQLQLATLIYCYFSCKLTELLDTVLFVLRKNHRQVTFLHVFHHTMMVWNAWSFLKYEPGYWMLFLGCLNSFIHILMYGYYGLSAFPSLHKYLWWKKYITKMQLIQFVLIMVQMTVNLQINECNPSWVTIIYLYSNGILFIYLFSKFYIQAYIQKKKAALENENKKNIKQSTYETRKSGTHEEDLKHGNGKMKLRVKNGDYISNEFQNYNNLGADERSYMDGKTK